MRAAIAGALAAVLLGPTAFAGWGEASRAGQPRLRATWHAPHGDPRASEVLRRACDDSTAVDTLYLSIEFPAPAPGIRAISGSVYFRPTGRDSLGDFWSFKTGTPNGGNMLIDFAPWDGEQRCHSPWKDSGQARVSYDRVGGGGRLDLLYAVDDEHATGAEPGLRYCFARIRIFERRNRLPGCRASACVDWANAWITYTTGRDVHVAGGEGRLAGWNTTASGCPPRPATAVRPWMPGSR